MDLGTVAAIGISFGLGWWYRHSSVEEEKPCTCACTCVTEQSAGIELPSSWIILFTIVVGCIAILGTNLALGLRVTVTDQDQQRGVSSTGKR